MSVMMRLRHPAIWKISLLFALAVASQASRGETLADISARATKTTVYVYVPFSDNNTGVRKFTAGSGFLVTEDGAIVTAYHVLTDWLGQNDEGKHDNPITVRIGSKYAQAREAAYLAGDQQADLAILRIREPQIYPAAPVCYTSTMQAGLYVFGFGFPNDHDLTPLPGMYSNANGDGGRWEAAAAFTNGMSGGPVYNDRGFVVGVIQGGVPLSPATSFVTPLRWARPMLESHTSVKQACFGSCRSPGNGIESWSTTTPWSDKTEWMGGGHNQAAECGKLQAVFMQTHPGQTLDITKTDEVSDKDFLGHVTYQYICSGIVKSGPIFAEKESPSCPPP
jgi:hypothetical protein